jgi:hypothetical protein
MVVLLGYLDGMGRLLPVLSMEGGRLGMRSSPIMYFTRWRSKYSQGMTLATSNIGC